MRLTDFFTGGPRPRRVPASRTHRPRARVLALVSLVALGAAACGSDEASSDPGTDPEIVEPKGWEGVAECAPIAESCVADLDGCRLESGEPTCAQCPFGTHPVRPLGACEPIAGDKWENQFASWTLEPGEEIGSLCQSWVLDNDTELFVNAVEFENTGAYHHSNWFFVPENYKEWTTEPWLNCYDDGFHEIDAALAGGVLYAQSTQVRKELQKFPEGVVVRIPPRSRVITVTHLLNYEPTPITTDMKLSFYTVAEDEVKVKLAPFQLIYTPLEIPPNATSEFTSECDLQAAFEGLFKEPLEAKLYYMLPHYHDLATWFEVSLFGGELDGTSLIAQNARNGDPFGRMYDPPIDLSKATGMKFTCRYHNPTDETVRWGIGDQEMCELLGFVDSRMAFSAGPSDNVLVGEEGGVVYNYGDCTVTGFGFSQTKAGGEE